MTDEKTPTHPHERPAPVVVRSGNAPPTRYAPPGWKVTPQGLAPAPEPKRASLVPDPEVFTSEEEITRPDCRAARAALLVQDWNACSPEQQDFLCRTARRLADITRKQTKPIPNGRY